MAIADSKRRLYATRDMLPPPLHIYKESMQQQQQHLNIYNNCQCNNNLNNNNNNQSLHISLASAASLVSLTLRHKNHDNRNTPSIGGKFLSPTTTTTTQLFKKTLNNSNMSYCCQQQRHQQMNDAAAITAIAVISSTSSCCCCHIDDVDEANMAIAIASTTTTTTTTSTLSLVTTHQRRAAGGSFLTPKTLSTSHQRASCPPVTATENSAFFSAATTTKTSSSSSLAVVAPSMAAVATTTALSATFVARKMPKATIRCVCFVPTLGSSNNCCCCCWHSCCCCCSCSYSCCCCCYCCFGCCCALSLPLEERQSCRCCGRPRKRQIRRSPRPATSTPQQKYHSKSSNSWWHTRLMRRWAPWLTLLLLLQISLVSGAEHRNNNDSSTSSSSQLQGLALALGIEGAASTPSRSSLSSSSLTNPAPYTGEVLNARNITTTTTNSSSGIFQLINRDAVLQRSGPPASSCRSCQNRDKIKNDSLEMIKMHILMRLHLTQLPNISAPVRVPYTIIEHFYRQYNASMAKQRRPPHRRKGQKRQPPNPNSNGGDFSKMLSDDPQPLQSAGFFNLNSDGEGATVTQADGVSEWLASNEGDEDDYQEGHDDNDDEEEEDMDEDDDDMDDIANGFYSRVNRAYIFPTFSRLRHHQRKTEVMNYQLELNHATVMRTIVHLYVRGRDWLREHEPDKHDQRQQIVIGVHRAVRRSNAFEFTHTIRLTELRHKIPPGRGEWMQFDLKSLTDHWNDFRNATLTLVFKYQQPWMRTLVVTGSDAVEATHKALTTHIEVLTKEPRRRKRSTSLDCQESDHEVRCCRYPLKVNFTTFGWHFVVAPTSFDAYFCNGECKTGYLEQYPHTHLASLTTSATPCCSPTKMSSLSLLYFDNQQKLMLSTIPNMSVEKCSCS